MNNYAQNWIRLGSLGSDRFGLLELRVFYTFLDILRSICSGQGYPNQCAATTSRPRSDRFGLLELGVSRSFLDQLRPQLSGHGWPVPVAPLSCS